MEIAIHTSTKLDLAECLSRAAEMMEKTRGEGLYFFKSGKEKYRMELDEFGRANYDFYIYYKG